MTRSIVLTLCSLPLAVGCASRPAAVATPRPIVVPAPASPSLAFTPNVARDIDEPNLDRADRGVYASAGYESSVVSVTYTRTDDDQRYYAGNRGRGGGDDSRYERRSISTSVTVGSR